MNRTPADVTSIPPAPPTPSFIRPALALLAGLGIMVLIYGFPTLIVTIALLRGGSDPNVFRPPTGFHVFTLVLGALGGGASGYAVARLTAGRSWYTLMLLALILCVSPAAEAQKAASAGRSYWHLISLAVLAPAGVLLGGLLARRRAPAAVATR
jgi:hypothetical protein